MHILFLTDNFPPEVNAAATRVFERARYWTKWGHQVTVITCAPNFPQGKVHKGYRNRVRFIEEMNGIRVVRVKTYITANEGFFLRTLDFLSFMLSGTVASMFERRPDIVVATSPQFFTAIAGWLIGKLRDVPFVFELSDLWPATVHAVGAIKHSIALDIFERIELFLYKQSSAVVALTKAFKRDLVRRRIDPDKIHVIKNGVELSLYSPQAPDEQLRQKWGLDGNFIVGYVGTHGVCQNLGNVLDAAKRLGEHEKIRFLFVGPGAERRELMDRASNEGIDSVVFAEPQPKERMPAVWSVCDVALVHLKDDPVFSTVIPSKIFEAMGMGMPILLVAPDGEARDILNESGAGIFVSAGDPNALASAVQDLAADRILFLRLAKASRAAATKHSREHQARAMLNVFDSLIVNELRF